MGIGPVGALQRLADSMSGLKQVEFGLSAEPSLMWFVYHKDMRRSARVQALQEFILQRLPEMQRRLA
jgi:DNA-binding transcriptional LysR family regulator